MAKQYGEDGPPHLHEIAISLTDAHRVALRKSDHLAYLLDIDRCWYCRIRCICGTDEFLVLRSDADNKDWISGEYSGNQRVRLRCSQCGSSYLLFDDGLHGYNAVVCDDKSCLPLNYECHNDALLTGVTCPCGKAYLRVFVSVAYDCLDSHDLDTVPQVQWDEAYGYFLAVAQCPACSVTFEVASAETA